MCKVLYIAALLGSTLCILSPDKAAAQQSDANDIVYEAARNKIGLMRYCRNNTPLDAAIAEKAVAVIEADLRAYPPADYFATEQGVRAEEAGEDGFLDAGRRRSIISFAQLFRTTRGVLCQEWAEEALRVREPGPRSYPISTAAVGSTRPGGASAPPYVNLAQPIAIPRVAPPPPLPAKAPARVTQVDASPQAVNTAAQLGPDRSAAPQILPTAAPLGRNAATPLPRSRPPAATFCNRDDISPN